MSPRFVEVLDVQSELSSALNSAIEKAGGAASSLDLSLYFQNSTTISDRVLPLLDNLNVSLAYFQDTVDRLNLQIQNSTLASVERPRRFHCVAMMGGLVLIFIHLVMVNVASRRLLKLYSFHPRRL
jgi:hypothetical protein